MKIVFVLFLLFHLKSFAEVVQKRSLYCLGPGLCKLVEKMIEPKYRNLVDLKEIPMQYSKEKYEEYQKVFNSADLLFSYPPSGLGRWAELILSKNFRFPNTAFVARPGEMLPYLYRYPFEKVNFLKLHSKDNPFLPFYFYPLAITNTSSDIYGFLKINSPFALNELPNLYEVDGVTYDLEECLSREANKRAVVFIFPDNILSLFFKHLGLNVRLSGQIIKKKLERDLFKFKRLVFFNFKGNKKEMTKIFKTKTIRFWDWEIFPSKPFLDPSLYLQATVLKALELGGVDAKKLCK